MNAVSLHPKELKLTESGAGVQLITPMMVHLMDENGNSVMAIPQEELDRTLDEAAQQIPDVVKAIQKFWQLAFSASTFFEALNDCNHLAVNCLRPFSHKRRPSHSCRRCT